MEWEEKRIKIEAEEELKRRQEYQRHEMQLFSILASNLNNPPNWQPPQEEFSSVPTLLWPAVASSANDILIVSDVSLWLLTQVEFIIYIIIIISAAEVI